MALKEKLMEDLKDAMKNKDELKKNTVTMIRAAIKQIEVDKRVELEDNDVIDIISKEAKKRKDALVEFEKAGRQDLIDQTQKEIDILKEYLPAQLSEEEVDSIIDEVFKKVNPTSPKDMGSVMREATPLLKGKADMGKVSSIIKERLNSL